MSNPMNFIRDFLKYVDDVGIFDEFDRDTQKMVTSPGVQALIKEARTYLPQKLSGRQAATAMRELSAEHRNQLIAEADKERVIDMRAAFGKKQSLNGGAYGLLKQMLDQVERGDSEGFEIALRNAKGIIEGPDSVYTTAQEVNETL